jgi:hypothetical protein
MTLLLRDAMMEILSNWKEDLDSSWRGLVSDVELGFDMIDSTLVLEPWEPIFPVRKGKRYPGAPEGAHMFHGRCHIRAFYLSTRCALKDRKEENQAVRGLEVGANSPKNGLFLASVTMPLGVYPERIVSSPRAGRV